MTYIIKLQFLPQSANVADVREHFSGLSIPKGGVFIVGGENGSAFIKFSTEADARNAMLLDGRCIKGVNVRVLLSSRIEMQEAVEIAVQQAPKSPGRSGDVNNRCYESKSRTERGEWDRNRRRDRSTNMWTRRRVGGSRRSRSPVANKVTGDGDLERSQVATGTEACRYDHNNLVRQHQMTVENGQQLFRTVPLPSVESSTSRFMYEQTSTDGRLNILSAMTYEWTVTGTWLWARRNAQPR